MEDPPVDNELELLCDRWPLARQIELPLGGTVVVAGSYKGIVCELAVELWHAGRVVGFEPQLWAYEHAVGRLRRYPQIELHNFGIGDTCGVFQMGEWFTDACSFVNTESREKDMGVMLDVRNVIPELTGDIDLFVMNMEGYEFTLLPVMLEENLLPRRLAIQWHFGIGGEDHRFGDIYECLKSRYRLVYDNHPVWDYWELR